MLNTLNNGGIVKVDASGVTSNLVISSGTREIVSGSGVANATSVGSSGSLVLSGGTASAAVLSAGGSITVSASGLLSAVSVLNGGSRDRLLPARRRAARCRPVARWTC